MKKSVFLILFQSTFVYGVKEVEKLCPRETECMSSSKCPSYQSKISQIKSICTNNAKRRSLISELKGTICNKEMKAVCCTMPTECGQSQVPPSSVSENAQSDCPSFLSRSLAEIKPLKESFHSLCC